MIFLRNTAVIAAVLMLAVLALGCDDGDDFGERATFTVTIENVSPEFSDSGVFNTPEGETDPSPIGPDQKYEFEFDAAPGEWLTLVTMFVQSNDLFYAPLNGGIELFPGGTPISGDITSEFGLWDAGTEVNEEPGTGPNQAPRQSGPDTGTDENGVVQPVANTGDGFTYPPNNEVIKVEVTATQNGNVWRFHVQIENESDAGNPYPVSPGVYVIHSELNPLFTLNQPDRGEGLEAIAEDGDPSGLANMLQMHSGFGSPIAPGIWAAHSPQIQLFEYNQPDAGLGLEDLAEDGDPGVLAGNVGGMSSIFSAGVFDTAVGAGSAGPAARGQSYQFTFQAQEGELFSFTTMMVKSNDLFFAFLNDEGIPLFQSGVPISGDFTNQIGLWDAGTEVNERPGYGPNQAPNQSGKNMGPMENGTVRPVVEVGDGFSYPDVSDVIRVTITSTPD